MRIDQRPGCFKANGRIASAAFSTLGLLEITQQFAIAFRIEQNAHMALQVAHRGYVLQTGEIVLSDSAATLRKDPTVQKAYLGID